MKKFYQLNLKKCRVLIVLSCIFFSLFPNSILVGQTSVPFTTAGATTWFCPAGVTSVTVECWGGGGAGGGATGSNSAGGGGAGGAYTKAIIAVSPGTTYTLFVGAGGVGAQTAGPSGQSSWFNTNTTLLAVGGTGGALASSNSSSANGATAPTTGNIGGTTNFYGGNGGKGSGSAGSKGGGGGGSAGTGSDGNDAVTSTGGTAVLNGGAGASGSTSSADGADATAVGGGGAGARTSSTTNRNGGNGFTGKVLISYTTPGTYKDAFQSMSIGAANWCAGETRTVTVTVKNTGTAAWVDAARQDINIGVKWDADPDYLIRTDVLGLAAGATGTYTFTVTAPATAGTNHLTFDVVYEAVSWFANNGGGVGPGNVVSQSVALTINALPGITTQPSASSQNLCKNSAATALSVVATGAGITYQWYSNTIGSNSGGSIIPGATLANYTPSTTTVGTLYYYCIVSGTCAPAITSNVSGAITVNAQPTATAGGTQTICQNGTATVSGATSSNGTILWSNNGVGSLSNATTLTPTYTAAAGDAGHTVTLTMTVSNSPCTAATATYSVIVNGLPTATAGGSQSICQSGTATVSGASSSNGTILWTHNGTGSLNNTTTLTPTYTAAAGDVGNIVTLTMTVTSSNACLPATATANYTVIVKAQPTATAGGTQTICQNSTATVSGASSSNGTILWTHNGVGSLSNATTLTPTYTAAAGDAGNIVILTMTVSNSPCTAATANYTVIVNGLPTATAGGSQSICQSGTATVSGASSSNGTILWTHNGTGSLTNTTTLTPSYTAAAGDIGTTVTLTMTVTSNNVCTPATATANYAVIVKAQPTATAGGTQTICQNGTATVSGASSSNGTILWTHNGVGSLSNATTLTPTYTAAAGDAGNTVTLTMTVSNNPCAAATATYSVIVKPKPTAAAGGSQSICQSGTATVSGATSSNGTILWTHNGTGSLSNATTLTPTYTAAAGDAGNTVTLTMTVSNSPCAVATATYSVVVKAQPTATAGGSQTICQNGTATVSGATSTNGTISWTENGAGSITSGATTLTPVYTAVAADAGNTVTLTMTVTNNPCTIATATYTVFVKAKPTASAGGNQTICQNGTATVSGASSSNGTILWTHNGTGALTNATTLTPTYTAVAGDAGNTVTLTMTVSNSPCAVATATYSVIVKAQPTANAGIPVTMCSNSPADISTGATSTNNNGTLWSTSGDGTFDDATVLNGTVYAPGPNDIAAGSVTITLTATGNSPCGVATSSKIVTITPAATAIAGTTINTCSGSGAVNITTGASATNFTSVVWTKSGTGTLANANSLTTATYTPSAADITAGFVTLTLTATGSSPCGNAISTKILSIASAPTAVSITPSTATICAGGGVSLTASATTSSTTNIAAGSDNFNGTPQYTSAGNTSVFFGSSKIFTQENSGFNDFLVTTWRTADGSKFMLTTAADFFGATTSTLTSPVINTTNYSSLTLSFQHTYKPGNLSATAQVQFSTDGGSTWTTVQSYGSSQGSGNNFVTVTIPATTLAAYINQTNLKIRFNYGSTVFFATSWWAVDNVTLNGTPIPLFSWSALPAGATAGLPVNAGTALASNKNITVTPTQTTVYTVTATDPTGSCTTSTATATVTVNQKSADPTSATASSTTICKGSSTMLTLNGGGSGTGELIHWYSASCGGTAVGTGNNLSVSPTVTTTYYGRYEDAAPCNYTSACASVTITVNQKSTDPTSATASSATICNGSSTILTLNGGGGGTGEVIHWYSGSCGGTPEGTGNNLSVSPTTTTTYYGRYEDGAPCNLATICKSVTITVNQKSSDPTSATASSTTICNGSSTILTLNGGGGGTGEVIKWYTGSCGGTLVGTGNNLSVSPIVTTTYYGRYEDGAPCNYTSACASVVINVNQPATAGISGNATICSGSSTNITFTATPNTTVTYTINGGSPNTINIDATGIAILNTGALFIPTTYSLVSVGYTAPPGCSQTISGSVTINITSGTWLGFTPDWNNAANWCGGIPTATTDVTIPAGTPNDPIISAALAMAHNITIAPGAVLTINGQTLQIAGNINSINQVDAGKGAIELNGTVAQNLSANTFMNNKVSDLIISNSTATGVTLGGAVDVYHSLTYGKNGAKLNTGGNLTLKSTSTQTAWIGDMTNHIINGDVTVERYIGTGPTGGPNHGKSWQFLGIPTVGQTIKQAWQEGATTSDIGSPTAGSAGNPNAGYGTMLTSNVSGAATQATPGFDAYTSAGPSIEVYDYLSGNCFSPSSTALPIYNQKGYFVFVRGDRSIISAFATALPTILRTKGTLFTPANPAPTTTVVAGKFESVGNPYASAIDMRNITLGGGANEFFYVWDPRLGSQNGYGAFQTFSKIGSDYYPTPGGGSYGSSAIPSNYIQSGQAFLVQATGSNGTVSFTESAKASGSALFTTPNPVNQVLHILRTSLNTVNADGSTGSIVDGVLSNFDDSYSNNIDAMDARKSLNTGENLSIKSAGKLLVIERRQPITQQDTIFFNLTGERNQPYRFHFDAENLDPSVQGFLVDNYLTTRTSLNMTGSTDVNFTVANVTGSNAAYRFMIVFEPLKALPVTFTSIKAYLQDKNISVEWKVDNELNINQYEVEKSTDGNLFTNLSVTAPTGNGGHAASYQVTDTHPVEGYNYYRVKSVDVNGKTSYTSVVKVLMGSLKQDITIYPNPITDGMIHLQLKNMPEGKYNIRLLNKLGQLIVQKKITHAGGNATELIKWDYNLAHGMYQLEVTEPDGTVTDISVMY